MRFALDSNILVYALIREDAAKHAIAANILIRSAELDAVLPAQVLGEFLNVIRRKHAEHFEIAIDQAVRWRETLHVVATSDDHIVEGARFAAKHHLQLWDAIIWQVAKSAGAALLLSEDLQDGLKIAGMRVLDPFAEASEKQLRELLSAV